jgi:hypothetical protein
MRQPPAKIIQDILFAFLGGLVAIAILAVAFTVIDGAFPMRLIGAWVIGLVLGTALFAAYRFYRRSVH